ncbi:uncharacterized protein N0V89_001689 [Didymosphaeria variabile]|uniref:ABM domain-containing protein n=1 Tax=Didymosphaeria variabile TaxID=1932322 RepID=A0A9W8XYK7_9PLEO|nr:uncharacterized protein N0V89_001689 [Didymosphaeria variabile]KAJ4361120.1 hypothetical protein N0V89_001689 [Didymosphaeria variabile]
MNALWMGKKFEDRYTLVYLILWKDLASSHAFFTGTAYRDFHKLVQPALNGRKVQWQQHALLDQSACSSVEHLRSILSSPALEVALTKVVEGGVHGYYEQFAKVVDPILRDEPGADGHFISPLIENPQDQLLLINWKSVHVSTSIGLCCETLAYV